MCVCSNNKNRNSRPICCMCTIGHTDRSEKSDFTRNNKFQTELNKIRDDNSNMQFDSFGFFDSENLSDFNMCVFMENVYLEIEMLSGFDIPFFSASLICSFTRFALKVVNQQ